MGIVVADATVVVIFGNLWPCWQFIKCRYNLKSSSYQPTNSHSKTNINHFSETFRKTFHQKFITRGCPLPAFLLQEESVGQTIWLVWTSYKCMANVCSECVTEQNICDAWWRMSVGCFDEKLKSHKSYATRHPINLDKCVFFFGVGRIDCFVRMLAECLNIVFMTNVWKTPTNDYIYVDCRNPKGKALKNKIFLYWWKTLF